MVNAHVHQKLTDIFLVYKVAKNILMYKNLPPQVLKVNNGDIFECR